MICPRTAEVNKLRSLAAVFPSAGKAAGDAGGNSPCQSSSLSFGGRCWDLELSDSPKDINAPKPICTALLEERRIIFHEEIHQNLSGLLLRLSTFAFFNSSGLQVNDP